VAGTEATMTKKDTKRNGVRGPQGRRFTAEQKQHALVLVASRTATREDIATTVGTTTESLRRWIRRAMAAGTMPTAPGGAPAEAVAAGDVIATQPGARAPGKGKAAEPSASATAQARRSPYAPADPAQGLAEHEVAAILELKRKHPSMGPAQLRAQLKRFQGWRVSLKAIARVLRGHGYELVHRGSRPKGPEPIRFEAPRRNALWQADFTEVRVGTERLHVLVILDDFSRYVVGFALSDSPSSQVATETLRRATARHGKPEAVRTDRGGAFVAFSKETDFGRFLEAELIDHIVGKSYRPRGGGKVESAIGTLKRELWDLEEFADRAEAEQRLAEFFDGFNESRAHMGIDGLTPADRFFGRADKVLAAVDAISRRRQGALSLLGGPAGAVEETLSARQGAPLEVLRLVLIDGIMELRFCGARVRLGRVET
jgi:transposase InsO family protein/transposase-like protein